jgi:hypothetical protein
MSKRQSILKALIEQIKTIDGTGSFKTNLNGNAYPYISYWDQVNDFPCVYATCGQETREYHPSSFAWGYINIVLKLYTIGEDCTDQLENLLTDVETVVNANRSLTFDSETNEKTTEILVTSIITDEGVMNPYGIGEIMLQVRYPLTM